MTRNNQHRPMPRALVSFSLLYQSPKKTKTPQNQPANQPINQQIISIWPCLLDPSCVSSVSFFLSSSLAPSPFPHSRSLSLSHEEVRGVWIYKQNICIYCCFSRCGCRCLVDAGGCAQLSLSLLGGVLSWLRRHDETEKGKTKRPTGSSDGLKQSERRRGRLST